MRICKCNLAILLCCIAAYFLIDHHAKLRRMGPVPCRRSKKGKRTMLGFFLAITTILSLSAGTAMAKSAPVTQTTQIASSQIDIGGSGEISNPGQLASGHSVFPGAATAAHATQPAVWAQEPESISLGTEP
jgi:hypothetical protein